MKPNADYAKVIKKQYPTNYIYVAAQTWHEHFTMTGTIECSDQCILA